MFFLGRQQLLSTLQKPPSRASAMIEVIGEKRLKGESTGEDKGRDGVFLKAERLKHGRNAVDRVAWNLAVDAVAINDPGILLQLRLRNADRKRDGDEARPERD